tara:strand:- start:5011 stop:5427 length:417 start_codon:yes stop_codon:yes gene_type:complete
MSFVTRTFKLHYLAFLLHIGELRGLPKFRPSWMAADFLTEVESLRGRLVDPTVEVMLKHFYASHVDGYFPFKLSVQLYEKTRDPVNFLSKNYHSMITMSGAELISDSQVSWRYFVVFLQLYKKLHQKMGDAGVAALFS